MPSQRVIFNKLLGGFFRTSFYIPKNAVNVRLQAVAFGGDGGIGDGLVGGGGGGAGAYFDDFIDVVPHSLLIIDSITEGGIKIMTIKWLAFSALENPNAVQGRQIFLPSGIPGADAVAGVAGVGGQSGTGNIGGASSANPHPEGCIDFNGLAHSTGGWSGTDASIPAVAFPNYALEKGTARLAKLKHPGSRHLTAINTGGYGGASYFGGGGTPNSSIDAGFGGGGSGKTFPAGPNRGGDAFAQILWDWSI